jgi:WD40 repeat protein
VTWPLQIYTSAIVFSPQTSIVRRDNLSKIPTWFRKIPQVEATWESLIQTLPSHLIQVNTVAFSPDGKQIASGSSDKTIKLWDSTIGNPWKTLIGHSGSVNAVVFSPDGKQIASGSWKKIIRLWDSTTGDLQKTLVGHSDSVNAVAFSPDGKQIASGSSDETIKLWDVTESLKTSRLFSNTFGSRLKFRAWQEIKTSEPIYTVKFSADGRYLVTNLGSVKVESIPADRQSPDFKWLNNLYVRNQWIYYGAAPVFLLPSYFQPSCHDVKGNQVTIGFRNGRVLSFNIDRRSLHLILELHFK